MKPIHLVFFKHPFICTILLFTFMFYLCTAAADATPIYSNKTDRIALLAFKELITEDPDGLLNSWNASLHLCDWHGVRCSRQHGRVVGLDLKSTRLTGAISPSIGNLTFLRSIELQDNRFHGNIPHDVSRLFQLQHLNFTNNTLQGEIPANLSLCSDLRVIDFTFNDLVGKIPAGFGSLSKLTFLSLFSNNLDGVISPSLGNLTYLKTVSLGNNDLEGTIPESIGYLTKLEYFGVGLNKLSGKVSPSIYNISSLTDLVIPYNQFTGSLPSDIGLTLPSLRIISVGGNKLTGPFPVSLSNASGMAILDLSLSNFFGPVPIDLGRRMKDLRWLNLGSNHFGTGAATDLDFLDSLTNCTNLKIVGLYANGFGGILPNSFANLSTQLRILQAGENQFVGSIPPGISRYVNLAEFGLEHNFLSGPIPYSIGMLKKLQRLTVNANKLSGPIPASIGNLSQLFQVNLEENSLSGSFPPSFENIKGLQTLNLSYNNLSGSIPRTIGLFSSLFSISLAHNSFMGLLPSEIGRLINLQELDFSKNRLSGEIPSILANCLRLEQLHLEGNLFWGSIPPSFSSLKGIVKLDLSHNNLSGYIPEDLQTLSFVTNLNLSFNNLEGEVPLQGVFQNTSVISIDGNTKLCGGVPELHLPACPNQESKKHGHHVAIKVIVIIASVISILLTISVLLSWKRRQRTIPSDPSLGKELFRVSYDDLLKATGGFASTNLIGTGSFGSVYKGILQQDEKPVAVKVLKLEQLGASKSFIAECAALRNTRHRNLLRIITACSSVNFEGNDFKALVYEFMLNGSLESWLHPSDEERLQQTRNLNLTQRLNIAIDIVSALDYLHHCCQSPIVHCDLKPSNVLLDEDMTAKVGDFGLAKFLNIYTSYTVTGQTNSIALKGSIGYVPPEYGMGAEVSTQGDVYSFGILLLEMLTGKRPTDEMFKEGLTLHSFSKMAIPQRVTEIVDSYIFLEEEPDSGNCDAEDQRYMKAKIRECLVSLMKVGVACSIETPSERVNMSDVLVELNTIKEVFLGVGIHGRMHFKMEQSSAGTSLSGY